LFIQTAFSMEFQIEKLETHTLIKVQVKRLENRFALKLKAELVLISGKGEKNIILELSNCSYCDSNGFAVILLGNKLCRNSGGLLVLSGLSGQLNRLITSSQVNTILNITENIHDAESFIKGNKILKIGKEDEQIALRDKLTFDHFKIENFERYTLIKVLGKRLETSIAPILKKELCFVNSSGQKNIILDISECGFCDQSDLSSILTGNKLCNNSGGIFVLSGANDTCLQLITISKLENVLKIAQSVQEAETLLKVRNKVR